MEEEGEEGEEGKSRIRFQGHVAISMRTGSIHDLYLSYDPPPTNSPKGYNYGVPLFANFFFFITGFHGFHVFSGIVLNIIIFFNVIIGTYEKRKSYEMVEKVGLYWHFVDLVWVFVFTFFYLV